jgi:hypothetical protein
MAQDQGINTSARRYPRMRSNSDKGDRSRYITSILYYMKMFPHIQSAEDAQREMKNDCDTT